jgi:hypothetical protein
MGFVVFTSVCELIGEVINQLIYYDKTSFEGLEIVDISLLDQLIIKVLNIHLVIKIDDDVVDLLFEFYNAAEWIVNHLFQFADSMLIIGKSFILLDVSLLNKINSFGQRFIIFYGNKQ